MRLALLLLAGCNAILGIDEPTRVPTDGLADYASCATSWRSHTPITVANAGDALVDYQLRVPIALAADAWIAADGIALPTARDRDLTWVSVPTIPAGTSALTLWTGNPDPAPPPSAPVFVDALQNPSFELRGSWDQLANNDHLDPDDSDSRGQLTVQTATWASDGAGSLLLDEEVWGLSKNAIANKIGTRTGYRFITASQVATFPPGSSYIARFDLQVRAASVNADGADEGAFSITLGDNADIWRLQSSTASIATTYFGLETKPFAAGEAIFAITAFVTDGHRNGDAKGYFDNFRIRRAADPEPVATLGDAVTCR